MHARSRSVPRLATGLVALATMLGFAAAPAAAQTAEAHHTQGGWISWPWMKPFGHGGWKAWTCEDGTRIRVGQFSIYTHTPIPWSFPTVNVPAAPDGLAPTDRILRYISIANDSADGLAVGDGGMWCSTANAGATNESWDATFLLANASTSQHTFGQFGADHPVRMWQSYLFESLTPPDGKYWVVGDKGLLATTDSLTNPGPNLKPQCFAPGSADPTAGSGIDLHGIDFVPGTYRGAVCGGGHIWFNDVDSSANCWQEATVVWTNNCGVVKQAPDGFAFYKISFAPLGALSDPDDAIGYAVGGFGTQQGRIFVTTDGGRTWTRELYECDADAGCQVHCSATTACTPPDSGSCPSYPDSDTLGDVTPSALYGVITYADGSAIAVGYGTAMLEREPSSSTNPRPWFNVGDRCTYPTFPLWGVHGDATFPTPSTASASTSVAMATGQSNLIHHRTNNQPTGNPLWVQDGWNPAWRVGRMCFTTNQGSSLAQIGWMVGPQFRIARTTDGGVTWTEQRAVHEDSPDGKTGRKLEGIAFFDDLDASTSNDNGVAVGGALNLQTTPPYTNIVEGPPAVYHTTTGGVASGSTCGWQASTLPSGGPSLTGVHLNFACSSGTTGAGQNEFWACGTQGTVLRSVDGGATWTHDAPPAPTPPTPTASVSVSWQGIAFTSLVNGVVVGSATITDPGSPTVVVGIASRRSSTGWTNIPLLDSGGGPSSTPLTAVHALGSGAIAVGLGGKVFGYTAGNFQMVATASSLTTFHLYSVRIVANTPSNDVFVGGDNGVLLRRVGGTWSVARSKTNANLRSLWFLDPTQGYLLGGSSTWAGGNSCLLSWQ